MASTNQINPSRLFLASCLALITTSMTFAFRARLESVFMGDPFGLSAQDIGFAFGPAFWGFTLAMVVGGPLVDFFGMKRIMGLAFIGHALGIVLTLLATDFMMLFLGTLAIGIGNGMVEAACNPLVASLYTQDKTKMLNRFHVWFPGGIVIGSVLGYVMMEQLGMSWQLMVGTLFIPLIAYGIIFWGEAFPKTERVSSEVSNSEMFGATLNPLFIFMVICMLFTAATELGTNQRIESLLQGVGVAPILVLAFINVIMALGRGFAGPVVHRLSASGVLLFSAIFSAIGLYWLSMAEGYTTFVAAAVFAVGICYFWPTMLGYVAENFPNTGALGLAIMGGAGMLSVSIVLPVVGGIIDGQTAAGADSGRVALRYMALLPVLLTLAFTFLYFTSKKQRHKVAA